MPSRNAGSAASVRGGVSIHHLRYTLFRPPVSQCGPASFRQLARVLVSQAAASSFFAATEFLDLGLTSISDRPFAASCIARPFAALILTGSGVHAADQNQRAQNRSRHGPLI